MCILTKKKNKNIRINFDNPEADGHDRNGLVERYIGLCKYIARLVPWYSNVSIKYVFIYTGI